MIVRDVMLWRMIKKMNRSRFVQGLKGDIQLSEKERRHGRVAKVSRRQEKDNTTDRKSVV